MSDIQSGPLSQDDVFNLQAAIAAIAAQSLAQGICLLLTLMALYTLIRQGLRESIARRFLLAAVLVVSLSSIVNWSTTVVYYIQSPTTLGPNPFQFPILFFENLLTVYVVCARINYVVSDIIVVWRAWILVDKRIFRFGLAACLLTTIGCTIAELTLTAIGNYDLSAQVLKNPLEDLILLVPVLTTNIFSTLIIAYKTWIYRRQVKIYMQRKTRTSQVEKILVLLIESGSIYAVCWILEIMAVFETPRIFPTLYGAILAELMPYISAVYPTLIILLVSGGKASDLTSIDQVPTHSIRFASSPPRPAEQSENSIIQSIADYIRSKPTGFDEEVLSVSKMEVSPD